MAAYAALVSLINTVDNIQNHRWLSTCLDSKQIETLGQKVGTLLDFMENHYPHGTSKEEVWEGQIASAAYAAEDVIESHLVDRIEPHLAGTTFDHEETNYSILLDVLMNVMDQILNFAHLPTSLDRKMIETLSEKVDFFLDFIKKHNSHEGSKEEVEDWKSQLESAAHELNDVFSRMGGCDEETSYSFLLDFLIIFMDKFLNYPHLWTSLDMEQIKSLRENLCFGLDILESGKCDGGSKGAEVLESQTASPAHAAKDAIESNVVDQIESRMAGTTFDHGETSSSFLIDLQKEINAMKKKVMKVHDRILPKVFDRVEKSPSFLLNLEKIIQDMDSIKEKVIGVEEETRFKDQQPKSNSKPAASSTSLTAGQTTMVGFDGYLNQLLDWLTREQSDKQIIHITGMGGIGKTTLAKSVYKHSLIVQHFDIRVWVTVSQEYNMREILLEILSRHFESTSELDKKSEDELGGELHKILFGRRYLIILDDVWSIEAWEKITIFLPENDNRSSRIVVTTRQSNMANHSGSFGRLALKFLDDKQSWNLFCEKAFAQDCCPTELEKIGRNIVKKCKGLPLSIVLIGGLLGKTSRTQEYWENVENDLSSSILKSEDNECVNILSLSYSHLPAKLKPCFLYLGIFSEDDIIPVSQLIKLWIAEGFLRPSKEGSLEETAKGYVKDLVDRNLVLIDSLSPNGEVQTCNIHDLLRELCLNVAEKEKFSYTMRQHETPRAVNGECRIISLGNITKEEHHTRIFRTLQSTSLARSVISEAPWHLSSKYRLLRVLYNVHGDSLDTAFHQVNLRFLECQCSSKNVSIHSYKLPSSISLLWNLQTIIIEGTTEVVAPSEIWEMQQLRHLEFDRIILPKPPPRDKQNCNIVLKNLQTLRGAYIFKFSEDVCERIPNIKKLHIHFHDNLGVNTMDFYCFYNVGRLNKLESLHLGCHEVPTWYNKHRNLKFPSTLKELSLLNSNLYWDDLTMIGSLPRLEVLKLVRNAVKGTEWNPVKGGFLGLKYLRVWYCDDLVYWNANSSHFPVLENLVLDRMWRLDEIPSDIGEIPTLRSICLYDCSISAAISAVKILEEQDSFGNQDLRVELAFSEKEKREKFREKLEQEGLTNLNFLLS